MNLRQAPGPVRTPKLVILLISTFLAVTAVDAQIVIDQQQGRIDGSVGAFRIGPPPDEQVQAQVVTQSRSGELAGLMLAASCAPDAALTIQIEGVTAAGKPNGKVVLEQDFSAEGLTRNLFQEFSLLRFLRPIYFNEGSRYAIVLRSRGECAGAQGPVGNLYGGGDGYYAYEWAGTIGWESISNGTGRFDLPFKTLVGDPQPVITAISAIPPSVILPASGTGVRVGLQIAAHEFLGTMNSRRWDFQGDGIIDQSDDISGPPPVSWGSVSFSSSIWPVYTTAGVFTPTVTITTTTGRSVSASTSLEILSPQLAVNKLRAKVDALPLDAGQKTSLRSTLDAASDSLARGNSTAACNQLVAFESKVKTSGHGVDATTADKLAQESRTIRSAIGCLK